MKPHITRSNTAPYWPSWRARVDGKIIAVGRTLPALADDIANWHITEILKASEKIGLLRRQAT